MNERRESYRRPLNVILNGFQDGVPVLCEAQDISMTGIRLRRLLDPRKVAAERIRLEIRLPGEDKAINVVGRPVRLTSARYGIGVRFERLRAADRQRIERYIFGD